MWYQQSKNRRKYLQLAPTYPKKQEVLLSLLQCKFTQPLCLISLQSLGWFSRLWTVIRELQLH